MSEQFLAALVQYGLPALFVIVLVSSAGAPLPSSLLLVATGSLVQQGQFSFWPVVGLGVAGSMLGDHLGYGLGRLGGRKLADRVARLVGGQRGLLAAESAMRRWGGPSIFLSRWLVTAVGPAINLTSGIALVSWWSFFLYDLAGETVWVAGYLGIGRYFSDQVEALTTLLGDLRWALLALAIAALLGWLLWRQRPQRDRSASVPQANAPLPMAQPEE
ncbi:MAG: DedA family protein [Herpetosiphonaceae bacterium]|nr:DedA family protein [Herpetosiphonaceae bacterium]